MEVNEKLTKKNINLKFQFQIIELEICNQETEQVIMIGTARAYIYRHGNLFISLILFKINKI